MLEDLWLWSVGLLTLYSALPTLWTRLGLGAVRRGPGGRREVALTFDDGPDPVYTLRLLEILKAHRVKACFFFLGDRARRFPDVVRAVAAAGHEIGVHGFRHLPQTFLGPRATLRDLAETMRTLAAITGRRPELVRPPWGVFNLVTLWAARRLGLRPVVWTVSAGDWRCKTRRELFRRVMRQVRPGSIVLLHDSGTAPGAQPCAPAHMLEALPLILRALRLRGYRVVPLARLLRREGAGTDEVPGGEARPSGPVACVTLPGAGHSHPCLPPAGGEARIGPAGEGEHAPDQGHLVAD